MRGADELDAALEGAFAHDGLVIVEAFSAGMEVECGVIGLYAAEASVPGEVVLLGGAEWYDYEAKYSDGGVALQVPARLPEAAAAEVRRLAVDTFLRVGCAGLARVDFFVEDGGRVLVNELNTLPGMTPTSAFPKLWEATGVPWPEACDRLLQIALERHARSASTGTRGRSPVTTGHGCPASRSERGPDDPRSYSWALKGQLRDRDLVLAGRQLGDPDEVVAEAAGRRCRA